MSDPSTFSARSTMPASADEVFALHERPGILERLTPPFERVEVLESEGGVRDGARTVLAMSVGPIRTQWEAEHHAYVAGREFVDVQRRGPFAEWEHLHRVEPAGDDASVLIDRIRYRLPLGAAGRAVAAGMVERRLRRLFTYRHQVLAHDLLLHRKAAGQRLRVAISGASGLIGRSLTALLRTGGHEVVPLVRGDARPGIRWDPRGGQIEQEALEGFDAVVNLAGENIGQRWTRAAKERIRESRWQGTRLLAQTLCGLSRPPSVFVSMSGVHYYGNAGPRTVDEGGAPGEGFLAEVCRGWEEASHRAADAGVRVVNPRAGVVLSPEGGALAKLKTPFALGLGGRVGGGDQFMSWASIDDAIGGLYWVILEEGLRGPVNLTAPEPVRNRELAETLARVLSRPAALPLPAAAVKLGFGEMGQATLLEGSRVVPRKLEESGYPFAHRDLESALRHLLGRTDGATARGPSFERELTPEL